MRRAGRSARLLVHLNARAEAWRLTPEALDTLMLGSPPGWTVNVAESVTSSDGDGGAAPPAEVLHLISDAEVYFGYGISRDLFLAAPSLRWVHTATAGVGGALFPEMVASDVLLTNSAGVYGPTIAEHVLGGVLYFLRAFDVAAAGRVRGEWLKAELTGGAAPGEVAGSRVLVIGAGGIGSEIALRFSALGAECVGVRRRPQLGGRPGFHRIVGSDALERELPLADIVILAAPGTPETVGVMNRERLRLLRQGAIVVNVARGTLLDEDALLDEVRGGRVRGAFLDVTLREPLPADSPLWREPRVFITPHVSAVAPQSFWRREMQLFLENWRRYTVAEPLLNLVDKNAGY